MGENTHHVDVETIERRLNLIYTGNMGAGVNQSSILPDGVHIHEIDYSTLKIFPKYLIDADISDNIRTSHDRASYWGWTAAAIETMDEVLDDIYEFPVEPEMDSWEFDIEDETDKFIACTVTSRFDTFQSILRFSMIYNRLERTIALGNFEELPSKAAIIADLSRAIEYMSFAFLEGLSKDIGDTNSSNWAARVRGLVAKLDSEQSNILNEIFEIDRPVGYLPSYRESFSSTYSDGEEFNDFLHYLNWNRNRLYHEAVAQNIGRYVVSLVCAVVWGILSHEEYNEVRRRTIEKLNKDLGGVDLSFSPEAGFNEFCLCTANQRYLEFYPFTAEQLSSLSFSDELRRT